MGINLEDRLLTLYFSGVYLSSYDLIQVGKSLGVEIPHKKREIVLGLLLNYGREKNRENTVKKAISKLINDRILEYKQLIENYPNSKELLHKAIDSGEDIIKELKNGQ